MTRQYMISKDFELYYYHNCDLPPHVSLHMHNYYEFYFFLEGNVRIKIQDTIFPLSYGDLILIPPNTPHKVYIDNMQIPYSRFVLWISQEYCHHLSEISPDYMYLFDYVMEKKVFIFHNSNVTFNEIQSRILHLLEEQRAERFGHMSQLTLCINDLILHLNRLVYEQNHPAQNYLAASVYENLTAYIERNLSNDLSLDRLASEFYLSKYNIAHIFKDYLGISVHQYITKKRLKVCREAIESGEKITEVYEHYGFGDYSCFFRAFKKEYGISPKDCQNMVLLKAANKPPME